VDIKVCDFDDAEYHILVTPEDKDSVSLSMKLRCAKDLMPMGAKMVLDQLFGQAVQDRPQQGYDVTLKWKVDSVKGNAKVIQQAAELKRIVMCSPFERCFEALSKDQAGSLKPMVIKYRAKETIYLAPTADRVLVFFSIDFMNETDRAIATVFLQEFQAAQRSNQAAPAVVFSKDAPGQLKSVAGFKEDVSCVGYAMFTIFKMHVDKAEKIKNAATLLASFRTYILYHVKASKTYLQSRMRMRVELMLKVMNRANPEAAEAEKNVGRRNTTTTTTKTFRRF
jgi:actin related protein 2/3 complex subunit 2